MKKVLMQLWPGLTRVYFADDGRDEGKGGGATAVADANTRFDGLYDEDDKPAEDETEEKKDTTDTGDEHPADEKAEKAKKDEEAETPTHSEELLAKAAAVGISAEEAADYSEKALERTVELLESKAQTDANAGKGTETDEKKGGEGETGKEDKVEKYDCGLKCGPDDPWDAEFVAALNKQGQEQLDRYRALEAKHNDLTAKFDKLTRDSEESQAARFTDQFDDMIEALGRDWEDVFGKGRFDDIAHNSKEFKARAAVQEQMTVLAKGYAASKKRPPALKQLLTEALAVKFPDRKANAALKEAAKTLEKRKGQTMARARESGTRETKEQKIHRANAEFDKKAAEE